MKREQVRTEVRTRILEAMKVHKALLALPLDLHSCSFARVLDLSTSHLLWVCCVFQADYERQFQQGMMTRPTLKLLMHAVETAADHADLLLHCARCAACSTPLARHAL